MRELACRPRRTWYGRLGEVITRGGGEEGGEEHTAFDAYGGEAEIALVGKEAVCRVAPMGGEDEVDHGEEGGRGEGPGDDISRRTLGDPTNIPSTSQFQFRASFSVIIYYLFPRCTPYLGFFHPTLLPHASLGVSLRLAAGSRLPPPPARRSASNHHAVLALCPHPHHWHAPYGAHSCPVLIVTSPVLTVRRAPVTRYGPSGRCVTSFLNDIPGPLIRHLPGHAMCRELRQLRSH